MKKIVFLFMTIIMPSIALGNISLSPFYLSFDADSKNRTETVRFTNASKEEKTYKVNFVNFKQESDGSYKNIEKPIERVPFADQYLEYSPHQVTLKPNDSQVVRVQRKGMASAPDGEYVSHLLIQEQEPKTLKSETKKEKGISINLNPLYAISIPVMIHKGNLSASGTIKQYKIVKNKDDQITADVTVERSGTKSFYGTVIVNEDGNEIGRVTKFRIFLSSKTRTIKIPLIKNPKKPLKIILIDENTNAILDSKDS